MVNRRQIGTLYEKKAAEYLIEKGYKILEYNYYCHYGEIDLIAKSPDDFIVFIEVKARKNRHYGNALEALSPAKCEKIRRTSKYYIYEKQLPWDSNYRYDVIAFQEDVLEHIPNAFFVS